MECDGHDFHERTKAQAAHDKTRDRALQARGLKVLRYTGSEIWADPFGCALDVLEHTYIPARDSDLARRLARKGDMAGALQTLTLGADMIPF